MSAPGTSFHRARAVRVVSGIASVGVVAGVSLIAASPASAVPVCDITLDSGLGYNESDIQDALTSTLPTVCLIGTFNITTGLVFDYDLTLYGLSDAVLEGDDSVALVSDYDMSHTLNVENITFTHGYSNSFGGALSAANVIVANSHFSDNSGFLGGAIGGYSVDVTDSTFDDNEGFAGGAIGAYTGGDVSIASITVHNSTFTSNNAIGGGAIYSYGVVNVYSSTFVSNTASETAGAVGSAYTAYVENSTFVENGAEGTGGALAFGYGGTVVQSTFLDNGSDAGEAVFLYNGGPLYLLGNIFAGTGTDAQLATDGPLFSDEGGNVFSTPAGTETALPTPSASTQFDKSIALIFNGATLADNGGPTQTVALYAGSPAVNAVPAGSLATDQRGVVRPGVSDAGAYEFVAPVLAATGSTPPVYLGGFAALLLAGGALVLGLARRATRIRTR